MASGPICGVGVVGHDAETGCPQIRNASHRIGRIARGMLHLVRFSRPGDRSRLGVRGRSELHTGSALGNAQAG